VAARWHSRSSIPRLVRRARPAVRALWPYWVAAILTVALGFLALRLAAVATASTSASGARGLPIGASFAAPVGWAMAGVLATLGLLGYAATTAWRLRRTADSLAGRLHQARREAAAELERALVTLRSIADAVVAVDASGAVEYMNPVAQRLTGWTAEEALGQPFSTIVRITYDERRREVPDPVSAVVRERRALRLRHPAKLVRRDGREVPISESFAPIRDADGSLTGVVAVLRDVSRERRHAARLSHQASHDALTGLVNRREFERRLEAALARAGQDGAEHALLFVDLDQFKAVNDTCGHAAGDDLIRRVASLLAAGITKRDTLGRLGGDEFGVLLEHRSLHSAMRTAEGLRREVAALRFHHGGRRFAIGASIGVVRIGAAGLSLEDAIAAADQACYRAKESGRNRVCLFEEDTEGRVLAARRAVRSSWLQTKIDLFTRV
jgi:diguanylate cyclase (GGDEF)-like protein/PAS domain S-box-containing protein